MTQQGQTKGWISGLSFIHKLSTELTSKHTQCKDLCPGRVKAQTGVLILLCETFYRHTLNLAKLEQINQVEKFKKKKEKKTLNKHLQELL